MLIFLISYNIIFFNLYFYNNNENIITYLLKNNQLEKKLINIFI